MLEPVKAKFVTIPPIVNQKGYYSVEINPTAGTQPQEQFAIHNIFVKDISFETPNSPQIFMEAWKPQVEVQIATNANKLQEEIYEVVLNITVTVMVGEKTAFLVEVHQAGIFAVKGFNPEKLNYLLHSYFANILFPFARETVANLVGRGGFQPLYLAPVNFDAIYAQRLQQQSKQPPVKNTIN
jgi:preprotein translocase subunit SecB